MKEGTLVTVGRVWLSVVCLVAAVAARAAMARAVN